MEFIKSLVYLLDPRNDTEPLRINEKFEPGNADEARQYYKNQFKGLSLYALGNAKPIVRAGLVGLAGGGLGFVFNEDFKELFINIGILGYLIDLIQYSTRGSVQALKNAPKDIRVSKIK